jgi:hypothetical protein
MSNVDQRPFSVTSARVLLVEALVIALLWLAGRHFG